MLNYSALYETSYGISQTSLWTDVNKMATTRLRKAFRYPSESDSDNEPDELDEEHQERLIADLRAQDAAKSDFYRKAFTALPILAAVFFLYTAITASKARETLLAFLCISSLLCTAYILYFIPAEAPDKKGKKPVYRAEAAKSPIEAYLPPLNSILAGALLIVSGIGWLKVPREEPWREALPASKPMIRKMHNHMLTFTAVIYGLCMWARKQLRPLDLDELHKARYEYKGA
jgi:hypothetical protein